MTSVHRLSYSPDGSSWATNDTAAVPPAEPTGPYWADMGSYWDQITLGWNAVSGASYYNVYVAWTGQGKYLRAQTSSLTYTLSMGPDVNHQMWVSAVSGAGLESTHSGPHQVRSGHPEARNSGSLTHESRPYQTSTWRPSDGWGYSGDDVLQGYFSVTSNNAFGTIHADGDAVNNWITANYGAGVVANMGYDDLALAVYRQSGSGTGNAVSQTYYVSPAIPYSGGQPPLAGGTAMGSHLPNNAGSWDRGIPAWWAGHVMRHEDVGNGPCHSFVIYRYNSVDYSRYGGKGDYGNAFNIYIATSWNFVTQNQANTTPW